jgi:hypothetical protein
MYEYWLKQRNSNPAVWCPYQMPNTVVTGLAMIMDEPPGTDAGWFWDVPGGIEILLNEAVKDEIKMRILAGMGGEHEL